MVTFLIGSLTKKLFKNFTAPSSNKKIVCYVEAAASYRKPPLTFTAEDIEPNLCTHLIYAFATLDPGDYTITPNDEEYDIVQG